MNLCVLSHVTGRNESGNVHNQALKGRYVLFRQCETVKEISIWVLQWDFGSTRTCISGKV